MAAHPRVYDFIVIGGGSAGSYLAHKLSQTKSVLLLEAGRVQSGDESLMDPTKSFSLHDEHTNQYFWALGMSTNMTKEENRHFPAVIAQTMGGGSAVNGMQFVHGSQSWMESISRHTQTQNWEPAELVAAYKELEATAIDVRPGVAAPLHAQRFVDALQRVANLPIVDDHNRAELGVFTHWQLSQSIHTTTDRSQLVTQRSSTFTKYARNLREISPNNYKSGNLHIITQEHVLRVLLELDCEGNLHYNYPYRATGVITTSGTYHANNVISCAGFQSPLLLLRSGIGPKVALERLGLTCHIDNAHVGQHIHNHPLFSLDGTWPDIVPDAGGRDTLSRSAIYSGGAFLSVNNDGKRDVQLIGISSGGGFSILALILNVKSEGEIMLQSSDPLRPPLYNFNYFSDPNDMILAIRAYRIVYATLIDMGLAVAVPVPKSLVPTYSIEEEDDIRKYILNKYDQSYHWTGSCRMANQPYDLKDSVVNSHGLVHGCRNLYVADASIYPIIPTGNTSAPAILAAHVVATGL